MKDKKDRSSKDDLAITQTGTYIFPNGDKYEGEFSFRSDGTIMRCGYGENTASDGLVCKGFWTDDQLNGKGTILHPSGAKYEGELFKNMMHGTGKYMFTDCYVYEGEFHENRLEGNGTLTDESGRVWCGKFDNKSANGLVFKLNM